MLQDGAKWLNKEGAVANVDDCRAEGQSTASVAPRSKSHMRSSAGVDGLISVSDDGRAMVRGDPGAEFRSKLAMPFSHTEYRKHAQWFGSANCQPIASSGECPQPDALQNQVDGECPRLLIEEDTTLN